MLLQLSVFFPDRSDSIYAKGQFAPWGGFTITADAGRCALERKRRAAAAFGPSFARARPFASDIHSDEV
ncbi:gamma-aminobutyrate permease [Paenibacillus popilliae ATCC 14706]|uniref:Gamma-aminobutyrate permease n=1 Tax=Paenibacillus popilliae ATCC 14706 TaxID=1212764 RepID=M9LH25_PAEPP|nr:gamma-aminobutyrate permease [Paenibacillus popilliae ATCC 14706]